MDNLKIRYFKTHLAVSFVAIVVITSFCAFYWFPFPFIVLDGTWRALLLLALIDLIIGPLLTFIISSSKKSFREQFSDLMIIVIIQVFALIYGISIIRNERVAALVHLDGAFHIVSEKDLGSQNKELLASLNTYNSYPIAHIPNQIASKTTGHKSTAVMFSINAYQPLDPNEIKEYQVLYENLPQGVRSSYSGDHIFKILVGKQRNAVVILDRNLTVLDIKLLPDNSSPDT